MKKKLILLAGAVMIAAAAFTFTSASHNASTASLLMQNVEALDRNEIIDNCAGCSTSCSGAYCCSLKGLSLYRC